MSSPASMRSTGKAASSSDGASPTAYTRRYNRGPFQGLETYSEGRFGSHLFLPKRTQGGPLVGIHMAGTSADFYLSEADSARLLCHVLIHMLDERGLPEALESLGNMVPFYATPPRPVLPEPEPVRIPVRMMGRYPAPVHSLPED